MELQIKFCRNADGARIAYSCFGQGSPWVVVPPWLSHQELSWQEPLFRRYAETIAQYHTYVSYDNTGTGLSDRKRTDFSLDAFVRDLEAVIDHLQLQSAALSAYAFGGPVAIAYTARHPEKVSSLMLFGTYASGASVTPDEVKTSMVSMIRAHWGVASRMLADLYTPAHADVIERVAKILRESATAEIAAKVFESVLSMDVVGLLPDIQVPTLVLHHHGDRSMPFRGGRELASIIPNAHFIPLEGMDTLMDLQSVCHFGLEFLGDPVTGDKPPRSEKARDLTTTGDDLVAREARSVIAAMDRIVLKQYRIVGDYTRYEENVRSLLKDVRYKITAGFEQSGNKRENHLIWAAPGSGKTYFAQQVAASLSDRIYYQECNLAKCGRDEFLSSLAQLDISGKPCLCLVDEVDAKPQEAWPYEVLLPYLDAAVERNKHFVFILAGSAGSNLEGIKELIARRPKGTDLLSRIPATNEYEIPGLKLGDRMIVVLSQLKSAGKESGREIREVEKLGLYYIALNSRMNNARQLRELAVRAVERIPKSDDRIKYDHMFDAGDPGNKAFWMQSLPATQELTNRFVVIED